MVHVNKNILIVNCSQGTGIIFELIHNESHMINDKLSRFSREMRSLIIEKINNKEINLPTKIVEALPNRYDDVNGELRYFINADIFDKIPDSILDEIEVLWVSILNDERNTMTGI